MRKLKVIMISILLLTVVGCKKEDIKEEVTYERIDYEEVEELVEILDMPVNELDYEIVNNMIYTIKADGIAEEYYRVLYEGDHSEQYTEGYINGWFDARIKMVPLKS